MKYAKTVDEYIQNAPGWTAELTTLREVLLGLGMEETLKWGAPHYVHAGRNVVGLVAFKDYFGLWFHDAEALEDPDDVLRQAERGKSKAMRQWRMTSKRDIKRRAIGAYVERAKALAEGPRPKKKAAPKLELPDELAAALKKSAPLRKAFEGLTPGRQREYAAHIGDAKREATRASRLEKAIPKIREGVGLNDHYQC